MQIRVSALPALLATVAVSGCAVYADGEPYPAAVSAGYYVESYPATVAVPYRYREPYYYAGRPYAPRTVIVTPPPRVIVRERHDYYDDRGPDRDRWRHDEGREQHRDRRDDAHGHGTRPSSIDDRRQPRGGGHAGSPPAADDRGRADRPAAQQPSRTRAPAGEAHDGRTAPGPEQSNRHERAGGAAARNEPRTYTP